MNMKNFKILFVLAEKVYIMKNKTDRKICLHKKDRNVQFVRPPEGNIFIILFTTQTQA